LQEQSPVLSQDKSCHAVLSLVFALINFTIKTGHYNTEKLFFFANADAVTIVGKFKSRLEGAKFWSFSAISGLKTERK
jgi:hypothetical protein